MANSERELTADISRRQFLRLGAGAAAGALLGSTMSRTASASGQVIRHVRIDARKVCLTYDDLWSEHFTFKICREYAKRNVGLTLFPIGYAAFNNVERPLLGYENLYPRLRNMGHEFGCHLYTHRDITGFSLQQLIDEEMEPALHVMRRALGQSFKPIGIRPPYGIVTDALRELSQRYGIPLILWGLDSQDAICVKANCSDDCKQPPPSTYESFIRDWESRSTDTPCSKERCAEHCVERMLKNYETYLRPGTIILHHGIEASYRAIKPTMDLLNDWNMQPIRLSELLKY